MEAAPAWRSLFENWPNNIPREGMLVTAVETVQFNDFMVSGGLLLIDRDRPDAMGARKVMVPYGNIIAVKMQTTMELAQFQVMGFQRPL